MNTLFDQHAGAYGAAKQPFHQKTSNNRRLNVLGVCASLFVPWILFCAVFYSRSFAIRHTNPGLCWFILLMGIGATLLTGALALASMQKRRYRDPSYDPSWYIFLFVTMILALIPAIALGEMNWNRNGSPSAGLANLNDYSHVDPTRMRGQQIMDAGTVKFVNGTALDMRLAMGFRNDQVYCVAPITTNSAPLAAYDFWAVGVNCCSGAPGDFKCSQQTGTGPSAGLRLMTDHQRPFFRLAVQQAEAMFNIHAEHPLFFYYVSDTESGKDALLQSSWRTFAVGMFAHFFFQLTLVIIGCFCFGKLGVLGAYKP